MTLKEILDALEVAVFELQKSDNKRAKRVATYVLLAIQLLEDIV